MAVQGHIDQVADGHIHGWAWDDSVPASALNVVVSANGRVIASAPANIFREDLQRAGIGDGRHGFDLAVPELTMKSNTVRILEELSQTEIGSIPVHGCDPVKNGDELRLVIDVTDIVVFLDKYNKLTGIPRVQVEILRAIVAGGLVGSFGLDIRSLFDFLRDTSCLSGRIQPLSNVSDARLASLYKGCLFTAYPSLYEGRGLPVTESLAFGKVCLCSRASALPEAGLDYCVYFQPEDVEAAARQAEKLIFDPEYRQTLEERIAREYIPPQWEHIAEKLIAKMREIGRSAHRPAPVLPSGVEVAFWLPQPYPVEKENIGRALATFSEGRLTNSQLTWDNYYLASSLVISGRLYPRTSSGWRGDPDGNTFSIALENGIDAALLNLYVLFEVNSFNQQIEFYCECTLINSLAVAVGTCLVCLKASDFVVGGGVRLFVRSTVNEAIVYKSFLLLSENDLCGRLTVREKFADFKLNRA